MPQWTEAIYPGLNTGNFTSHGVAYDIDNPGVAPVSTAAIHGWLDALGCHPAFGGWILAGRKSPLATKNLLEDTDGLRRPP